MLKQPCYFYNTTGKCRFGKHCRFAHELGTPSQAEIQQSTNQDGISVKRQSSISSEPNSFNSVARSDTDSHNESIKQDGDQHVYLGDVCKFFATGKYCRFGRRCRFQHVRGQRVGKTNDDDLKAVSSQNAEQDKVQNEGEKEIEEEFPGKGNGGPDQEPMSNKQKKEQKSKRKQCKFFKEGSCRFGNKCRFIHSPKEAELTDGVKDLELSNKKCDTSNAEARTKSQPQNLAAVRPPQVIKVFKRNEISKEKISELHQTEINQLKRRFPADRLKVVEEGEDKSAFIFTFTPTDPDWVRTKIRDQGLRLS